MSETPEALEIRTADGRGLGAELLTPRRAPRGTAILAHPMFANRSVFDRPRGAGVARLFHDDGWRTLAFDFRGHGESTSGGRRTTPEEAPWTYDELVRVDLPAVVGAARARFPDGPVVVVGHSLGGHVALASAGAGLIDADALVVAGANVWMRRHEPSLARWAVKLATISGMAALAARHRYFPVRALRLGTDDEAAPYIDDLARFALRGGWTSRDGAIDYDAGLAAIRAPVFSLTSAGDRLYCVPESAGRFLEPVPHRTEVCLARGEAEDGAPLGPPPDHMGLLTARSARGGWRRALAFLGGLR